MFIIVGYECPFRTRRREGSERTRGDHIAVAMSLLRYARNDKQKDIFDVLLKVY